MRPPGPSPLAALIETLVRDEGPLGIDRYMALALGHPGHGYYATRDPFGPGGDFTTAPEISQMFGEMIGLWCAEVWHRMGRPAAFALVELGPGRGTLMADALRACRVVPGFLAAASLHLVETSPALRERQRAALSCAPSPVRWHETLAGVPDGPALLVANEFLDALPIRQFVRGRAGWHERLVGLSPEGGFRFGLSPAPVPGLAAAAPEGAVLEVAEAAAGLVRAAAARLAAGGGAALVVDYGHAESGFGDTLQAVRDHAFADPLADPGEADLTAHVDFAALARVAAGAGATVHGPVGQGAFLDALGIAARAERLAARAAPAAAAGIAAALDRLTGEGEGRMGALFKAIGLSGPGLPDLPGLPRGLPPACRARGGRNPPAHPPEPAPASVT